MKTNCVITIGRQFGSGGRYVGRMLAEKLGIPFYDKELLSEAAKQSGICEEIFEDHDEKPTRSLLFNLVTGMQVHGDAGSYYMDMPLNHKIFLAQFDAIRSIADKGPCVIVGRCADYVLKDRPNTISVFLKAEMQSKVERAVKYYGVDPQKAEDRIRKADKQRASYYNYYATATWGDVNNYDLCVDTASSAWRAQRSSSPASSNCGRQCWKRRSEHEQNPAPRGAAGADDDARVRSRVGIWRY